MATALQIKALVESHFDNDEQRFKQTVLQICAHSSKNGPTPFSNQLTSILKREEHKSNVQTTVVQKEILDAIDVSFPQGAIADVALDVDNLNILKSFISEHSNIEKLKSIGLSPQNKLLLVGPSGTGKTMTASALAGEMCLPLYSIKLDSIISKYMGETAAKLRQIFEHMSLYKGVYFFDEFDSIGSKREMNNDVGEARRILNSFLIMMEQSSSESIIVAATNFPSLLDSALFRRFDSIICYTLPTKEQSKTFLIEYLKLFVKKEDLQLDIGCEELDNLLDGRVSYAIIKHAAQQCVKNMIINNSVTISSQQLLSALENRQKIQVGLNFHNI